MSSTMEKAVDAVSKIPVDKALTIQDFYPAFLWGTVWLVGLLAIAGFIIVKLTISRPIKQLEDEFAESEKKNLERFKVIEEDVDSKFSELSTRFIELKHNVELTNSSISNGIQSIQKELITNKQLIDLFDKYTSEMQGMYKHILNQVQDIDTKGTRVEVKSMTILEQQVKSLQKEVDELKADRKR